MKSLLIMLILANAGDATLTIRNMTTVTSGHRFVEENPLMRPLFKSPARVGMTFGVGSVTEWAAVRHWGHRHPKLVKVWLGGELGSEAWGVEASARGHHSGR